MPIKKIACFLAIILCALIIYGQEYRQSIDFNNREKDWIKKNSKVSMCVDPDWKPFESIDRQGNYVGIASDILSIISQRSGIEFEIIPTTTWDESIEFSREGKCLIMSFLNQSPERDEWLIFTVPYFIEPNVFITREEHDYISPPGGLHNKTIVLPTGTSIKERILQQYPQQKIIEVDSEKEAIRMVSYREADMTLRSLTLAAYIIKTEGLFNLKIAGQLPGFDNELRMGIRKEHAMLRDILNKTIATLSPLEVEQAVNNHISISVISQRNYWVVIYFAMGFGILLLIGLLWNYQLRNLNRKLAIKQKNLAELSNKQSQEIEARMHLEEQLLEKQQQLQSMISNLPGFIYRCTFDHKYSMQFISDGCEDITGYGAEEFLQNDTISYAEIIHPYDSAFIRQQWTDSLESKKHFQREYRIIHRDGNTRNVWERGHGVFSKDGELLFLEGFINEVTDLVKTREELRDYSEMTNMLMNSTAEAIYGLDKNGICTFLNNACLQILGYESKEHILGKNMHFLIHHTTADGQEYPENDCKLRYSFQYGEKTSGNNEIFFKADGTSFPVEYWSYPIIKEDEVIGGVVTFFDITERKKAEQALYDSEKKYRLITENTSDVIWVLNISQDRFTFISPSIYQLRGITVEEAMKEKLEDSLTPESLIQLNNKIRESVQNLLTNPDAEDEPKITIVQQTHKNGELIWVEMATKLQFNDREELEITGTTRNIEGRKKMEEAILYKNQMQQTLSTISSEFVTANNDNLGHKLSKVLKLVGSFFKLDRAYIFSYSADNKYFSITHEWCLAGVDSSFEFNQKIAFNDFPWWTKLIKEYDPIYIPDVTQLPKEATKEKDAFLKQNVKTVICFPVIINGTVTGLMGYDAVKTKVDITPEQMLTMQLITNIISETFERIKTEKALAESESISHETAARYQAFVESTNTGAWELNKDTNDVWYNPEYYALLGYSPDEFDISTPQDRIDIWQLLIHPDDFQGANAYLENYLKNPEGIYEQVFRMKHKNGNDVWILSKGKFLEGVNGKNSPVIVGTHTDITVQKQAEETIRAKNKELETYLYVASHDLRSPLVNIQGFGNRIHTNMDKIKEIIQQVCKNSDELAEVHKIIQEVVPRSISIINSNVDKMNDLINGLLAVSRTGRLKMNITPCNINQLMQTIIRTHIFQIEQAQANVETADLPDCYGDEGLLDQLFSNLIDNAIKYKKPNEPLHLKIEGKREKYSVVYSIQDNGLGISERNQKKIWDIFYRVDDSSEQKGDGIGLNMASKIVEKHKGNIWVKSKENEGSTFFVQLSNTNFQE